LIALFDTNIILDLLTERPPFFKEAALVFNLAQRGDIQGVVAATSVTTIYYIMEKQVGPLIARENLRRTLTLLNVAPVTSAVLENALALTFKDYEDAVIHEAARHAGADAIVTRDTVGFKSSTLPVYTPDELLGLLLPHEKEKLK
jgi:predicted nucleic acid-binding protein